MAENFDFTQLDPAAIDLENIEAGEEQKAAAISAEKQASQSANRRESEEQSMQEQAAVRTSKPLEPVAQPQSAYVLFIKSLRQKQKAGTAEKPDANSNFLSDASKQWAALEPADKKEF